MTLIVIRISGMVDVPKNVAHTLDHLNLRRKYCAILLPETPESSKILNSVRSYVAFGNISNEHLSKLISLRGESLKKGIKIEASMIIKNLDKKSLKEQGMKPFFRLHPPRKGIKSKLHYPKGVLGDNKSEINKLLERMF